MSIPSMELLIRISHRLAGENQFVPIKTKYRVQLIAREGRTPNRCEEYFSKRNMSS